MLRRGIRCSCSCSSTALAGPAYAGRPAPPPTGTDFDYQLGGNRPVPDHVGIVVRDREAAPAAGRYNVCYVNGFQTQPNERRFWRQHWQLVLKEARRAGRRRGVGRVAAGHPHRRRSAKLARIVGRWIDGCAADGYAAVEFDNLDSFARSHGLIDRADTHERSRGGWSVARTPPASPPRRRTAPSGTAAASASTSRSPRSARRWRECGDYVDHYGRHVLAVEYRGRDFRRACRDWADQISVVRRDVALSRHGVRRWC